MKRRKRRNRNILVGVACFIIGFAITYTSGRYGWNEWVTLTAIVVAAILLTGVIHEMQ